MSCSTTKLSRRPAHHPNAVRSVHPSSITLDLRHCNFCWGESSVPSIPCELLLLLWLTPQRIESALHVDFWIEQEGRSNRGARQVTGWRKCHDVFRSFVSQVVRADLTEKNAQRTSEFRGRNFKPRCPAGRAVCRHKFGLTTPPHRPNNCSYGTEHSTRHH